MRRARPACVGTIPTCLQTTSSLYLRSFMGCPGEGAGPASHGGLESQHLKGSCWVRVQGVHSGCGIPLWPQQAAVFFQSKPLTSSSHLEWVDCAFCRQRCCLKQEGICTPRPTPPQPLSDSDWLPWDTSASGLLSEDYGHQKKLILKMAAVAHRK